VSALADIAYVNREVYNLSSLLQEFLARQCFNFLVLDEELLTDEGRRLLGVSNALPARREGVLPQYATPPVDPAAFLQSERAAAVREIFRLAVLGDASASERRAPESGVAKAYDFHDANQNLARKAQNLEQGERRMVEVFFKWIGAEPDYAVHYPRDFDVRDLASEIADAARLIELDMGPTFNVEVKKRLGRRVLGRGPRSPRIDAEIESAELMKS
jgi:hypothetical protein